MWIFIYGHAAIMLAMNVHPAFAEDVSKGLRPENDSGGADITGLQRIEDGSIISNLHTSKWRVFTDQGRELFLQGRLEEAEKLFLSALEEAKEGFGQKDPHVASACNNLAELYRVKKAFDKAEPLYLDAIGILEESFGPEDIRVAAALHNLGQFYVMQRKLEKAHSSYERALKIKRRVLGCGHTDYADTMHHLGVVLYLLGNEKDSEALIQDSIRILEEAGQGESVTCIKRLRCLAQVYSKSHRLAEAEKVQRKILHIMELAKGWNSLETSIAAEDLALTLQQIGSLGESKELLEHCLESRKSLQPEEHVQVGANMLNQARVAVLNSKQLRKKEISEAIDELNRAKDLLGHSIRIARGVLDRNVKYKDNTRNYGASGKTARDAHAALVLLLQSLDALGLLAMAMQEFQESKEDLADEAENAFRQCISAIREFRDERFLSDSPQVKTEHLSCLTHFLSLMSELTTDEPEESSTAVVQELKNEIKTIDGQLPSSRRRQTNTGF